MTGTRIRTDAAREAAALRAESLSFYQIAARMGISYSYASELIHDPTGAVGAARKQRYRGVCESCGGSTHGSNGAAKAPRLCLACYNASRVSAHGTSSRYKSGCRCDACRAANTEVARLRYQRGGPPPSHGVSGYTNYGCRCDICTRAQSDYQRQRRSRSSSRWSNRIYPRKFNHDEARTRHAAGESIRTLAAEYGVHYNAVWMALNPEARARASARAKAGRAGTCEVCGGTALAASHAKYTKDGRAVCRRCRYDEMRERLRFDDLGRLVAVRCRSKDCANGEHWQAPEMFPRGIRHREVREGGIHGICRACNTRMRRAYRDRGKVPCEGGCGAMVEGTGRANIRTTRSGRRVRLDPNRQYLCAFCVHPRSLTAATLPSS